MEGGEAPFWLIVVPTDWAVEFEPGAGCGAAAGIGAVVSFADSGTGNGE